LYGLEIYQRIKKNNYCNFAVLALLVKLD